LHFQLFKNSDNINLIWARNYWRCKLFAQ